MLQLLLLLLYSKGLQNKKKALLTVLKKENIYPYFSLINHVK